MTCWKSCLNNIESFREKDTLSLWNTHIGELLCHGLNWWLTTWWRECLAQEAQVQATCLWLPPDQKSVGSGSTPLGSFKGWSPKRKCLLDVDCFLRSAPQPEALISSRVSWLSPVCDGWYCQWYLTSPGVAKNLLGAYLLLLRTCACTPVGCLSASMVKQAHWIFRFTFAVGWPWPAVSHPTSLLLSQMGRR